MIKSSRREAILKMGAWPLLWPLLRSGRADAQTMPKRVVIIFSPNGPIMERGPATGSETNFTVHDWWAPVARHKADGFFFAGMQQAGVPFGNHNEFGHQSAGTGALTARTTEGTNNATGPSLDQFIGQELQKKGIVTPLRSVLWGLVTGVAPNWGPFYEAAGKPLTPQVNPFKALAEIAPSLTAAPAAPGAAAPMADPRLVRKRFVLDLAYKDCKEIVGGLGSEGKALLDFHCTNIESLQKGIIKSLETSATTPMPGAAAGRCMAPTKPNTTLPSTAGFHLPQAADETLKAFADLIPLALACDVTRVIGFSLGTTAGRLQLPTSYNVPSAAKVDSGDSGPQHHAWTHTYNTSAEKKTALKTFNVWFAENVARIIDKLKATPDADGKPLMDSTLVLWTSELGHNAGSPLDPHPNNNIPVMLFGNSQGAFKPNRFHNGDNSDNSALTLHKLFVSIIQHTGLTNINAFGKQGSGALDWLKG